MNKLIFAITAAVALALTGCGGSSSEDQTTATASKKVFSTDQTCDQLFDDDDEGRMFGAVAFLAKLPDTLGPGDLTKAKIFATDLEYVAGTANDEMKPLVETMATTLNDLAAAEGTSVEVVADDFKTAGSTIIDMCPAQAAAYNQGKADKEAAQKAAADAAKKKASEEAAAKAAAAAAAAPKVYSGAGADVVKITKHDSGPQVAIIQHTGGSNFAVHSLDASMASTDLLVNTIGNYTGTVVFDLRDGEDSKSLKITADGPWTIKLIPFSSVKSFDGSKPMTGRGDDVFIYRGEAAAATFTHNGLSNIALHVYGSRADLLVNEIGAYKGTIVWAPGLYRVTADGDWSATLK